MMTMTIWLRISAVISLLFTIGHTIGGLERWSPMGDNPVLQAMSSVRFEAMGVSRTYLDFFMAFGWLLSVTMLMQSVLLWQLASIARTSPASVRPLIAVFALATAASAVIAWRMIFPLPALFATVLAACLAIASVLARGAHDVSPA
jgi:hypothetical protein